MSKILDEIRRRIKDSDMSVYRLAKETDIDQSQLSRFINGKRGLTIGCVERVARVLGLEIEIRPKKAAKKQKRR